MKDNGSLPSHPVSSRSVYPRPAQLFPLGVAGKPALLAHRGAPRQGVPENSREAFDECLAGGEAAGLETDLQATRDGYPVISHDPFWHGAKGDVEIAAVTWKELSRHRLRNGEVPLGLEEFLDRYPGIYVNIDFKVSAVVPQALKILEGRGDLGRMALASFSAPRVWKIARRLGPQPGYLPGGLDVARFLLACESGVIFGGKSRREWETNEDSLGGKRESWQKILWELREKQRLGRLRDFGILPRLLFDYHCAFAVPETFRGWPLVTRRFVAGAHAVGCPVYVWTVNDANQYRRLAAWGVDAVYSDIVHTLRHASTK